MDLFRSLKPASLVDQDEQLRANTIYQSDFLTDFFSGSAEINFYEMFQICAMVLFGVIGIIIKGGIFTYGTTLS